MQLIVKKLSDSAKIPSYAHVDDAGLDLHSVVNVTIHPGERYAIPCGIAVSIEPGHVGLVHPRSGLAINHGVTVLNAPGTIDAGYRGEIKVILHNASDRLYKVKVGDRIAQMVIQRVESADIIEGDLDDSERSTEGFGSTGV